jgi:hypothetical protein
MGCRGRVVGVAIAAFACMGGQAVAKGPPTIRFIYERAPNAADCPDKEIVLDAVKARLGFDPFREPPEIVIRASVSRTGDELAATMQLSEQGAQRGERRLVSRRADCSELASAMELELSIAIDPLSISRESPSPRPPAPITVVVAPPSPGATPRPPTVEPSAPKFLLASGGALGNVGASLAPALGFQAGFGVGSARWSVSIEGRADLPTSKDVEGGHVTLSTLAGTVAPCLHRGPFGGCLLVTAMALRGSGYDLADARQLTTALVAVGARAAVEIPSGGSFAIRAHLDVLSPLARTTLKVGGNAVWTSPPVSAALGLAAVVKFR